MKACLMHHDRDFELPHALEPYQSDVRGDLELDTLLDAMAGEDELICNVALSALMDSMDNDGGTILYRQAILQDAMRNPAVTRDLYRLAGVALEGKRKHYFGVFMNYPSGILHGSMELMQMLLEVLKAVRQIADLHHGEFSSAGFSSLLAMLRAEFGDAYFEEIRQHLSVLKLKGGVLESARLGQGNDGTDYVLRLPKDTRPAWLARLLRRGPPAYTFRIADRDEAGARALSQLRDRGLNLVANALAQSTEHILSFFEMLRTELAFYVGCLNLRERLAALDAPLAFPMPGEVGHHAQRFDGLYDPCLALQMGRSVVGNTVDIGSRAMVVITGANQGGKSSFLRSIGLAQLMMQSGMFVAATAFTADLCSGVFTHYKREEDNTMTSGKFDEELRRMGRIVDAIRPNAMVLFNESFASTNEREGSEVARQIVKALLSHGIKVYFVTHLYDFAHSTATSLAEEALFLRAERRPDGSRTFKLVAAEPLDTSYGEDLYREVFLVDGVNSGQGESGYSEGR